MKTRLVSFKNLQSGDVFMLNSKDRVKFKKLGPDAYIPLQQSSEVARMQQGQIVIIRE